MRCAGRLWLGVIAIVSAVGLAGCDRIEQTTLNDQACDILCECTGQVLPTSHRQCLSSCVQQLPSFSQECLTCIGQATCPELGADSCDDVCF